MSFNPDPSEPAQEVVFFHKLKKTCHPSIYFNNKSVKQVLSQNHLGMILDTKLNFKEHLKNILNKANKTIGLLRKLQNGNTTWTTISNIQIIYQTSSWLRWFYLWSTLQQLFPPKTESAKSLAWRACVLACFACLRARVLTCLACLHAYVLTCLVCLRVYVRACYDDMFYFFTCLRTWCAFFVLFALHFNT